jgi:phosphatidylglycerophosphate synthase
MSASWPGKVKTALQIIAISLLIIYEHLGAFERLGPIALWLAMIATLVSGVDYLVRYGPEVVSESATS